MTEKFEMDSARQRGWREKFKRRGRCLSPGVKRMNGKCPLTPLEVTQKAVLIMRYPSHLGF